MIEKILDFKYIFKQDDRNIRVRIVFTKNGVLRRNLCLLENIQKIPCKYLDQIQIEMFTCSGSEVMLLCNRSRNQQRQSSARISSKEALPVHPVRSKI